jgi:hypothetical protein
LVFFLLSGADLLLTHHLLKSDGGVGEANPVARACLEHGGWTCLAAFKAGAVVLTVGATTLISRSRPLMGRRILGFSCAALAVIVAYSGFLSVRVAWFGPFGNALPLRKLEQEAARVEAHRQKVLAYRVRCSQLASELKAEDKDVLTAALELLRLLPDRVCLDTLRALYPGRSDLECLAASLIEDVAIEMGRSDRPDADVIERLLADYRYSFDTQPPWSADHLLRHARGEQFPKGDQREQPRRDALAAAADARLHEVSARSKPE